MSNEVWYIRNRNKITGPFQREQLEALRRRGQLARFHEVSRDQETWILASSLPALFASTSRSAPAAAAPDPIPTVQPAPVGWFYSSGQRPVGPVGKEELVGLLKSGRIDSKTLVWTEGLANWIPLRDAELDATPARAGDLPRGASASATPYALGGAGPRARKSAIPAVLSVAIVLTIACGLYWKYMRDGTRLRRDAALATDHAKRFDPREAARTDPPDGDDAQLAGAPRALANPAAAADEPAGDRSPLAAVLRAPADAAAAARVRGTINSMTDAPELASAVGLVLCGATLTEFDGTRTETCLTSGTCFVASEKGYLITNRHVVENISKLANADAMRKELEKETGTKIEPKIWVFFRRKKYEASIQFVSDDFDVAVLKVRPDGPLRRFRLAESEEINRGLPVFALGFPGASRVPLSGQEAVEKVLRETKTGVRVESRFHDSNFDYVITDGIVSVLRREGGTLKIEHTARISAGNSGGPLAQSDGTVIGINTLVAKESEDAVPTYVALGVTQLRAELVRNVPDLFEP